MAECIGKITELNCVQLWTGDEWRTIYVSSFYGDANEVFRNELGSWDGPKRLVTFVVNGVDFIATHATDYAQVSRSG